MKLDAFACRTRDLFTGETSWRPYHPELYFKNWALDAGRLYAISFHWLGYCAEIGLIFAREDKAP